jgi:hypothetical protein
VVAPWAGTRRGTGEVDRWDMPRGGDAAAAAAGGLAAKEEVGFGLTRVGGGDVVESGGRQGSHEKVAVNVEGRHG